MKKSKSFEWNKVTPFSKYLAMALFITLPFVGFLAGMRYQQMASLPDSSSSTQTTLVSEFKNKEDLTNSSPTSNLKYDFNHLDKDLREIVEAINNWYRIYDSEFPINGGAGLHVRGPGEFVIYSPDLPRDKNMTQQQSMRQRVSSGLISLGYVFLGQNDRGWLGGGNKDHCVKETTCSFYYGKYQSLCTISANFDFRNTMWVSCTR